MRLRPSGDFPSIFMPSASTFSRWGLGHKCGAPSGSGVLLATREVGIVPVMTGGGQERQLRSGTPAVATAQALAAALTEAVEERPAMSQRHARMRERLISGLPDGIAVATQAEATASITMFVAPGCSAEALVVALDAAGIAASAGSACHTGVSRPSPTLLAQGISEEDASGSLRVSFGWATRMRDVEAFLEALPGALDAAHAYAELARPRSR
nr:aminotransferase class V-fold PLP-dependent enzyme [Nanchangia anserum]